MGRPTFSLKHPSRNFLFAFFSQQRISQRGIQTSFEKQLDLLGPNAFQRGSVPDFLRNHLATSAFPGGGVGARGSRPFVSL